MRYAEIKERLLHVCGWMQDYNPVHAIEEDMTESESGLNFQAAHPLLTLDNMRSVMPDGYGLQYPVWNAVKYYRKGDKVQNNNVVYIATQDSTGEEPTASDFNGDFSKDYGNPYWRPYNQFSDYLRTLTENSIATAIQRFITEKQMQRETQTLLEMRTFFDGAGRVNDTIRNENKLVGFEIIPVRANGVTTKIEEIGLQFNANGPVTLYLFHSSDPNPKKIYNLNYTGGGRYEWHKLSECYLPYVSADNMTGGSWFLCYNQADLPEGMSAINFMRDWSREPCGTCNRGNLENYRELTKYIQISPFKIHAPSTFKEFPEMWDLQDMLSVNTQCFGLNARISVMCDLTDFVIEQRAVFAHVIQLQVAYDALRLLALNPNVRVNRNQVNATRSEILYELDGNTQGREGGLRSNLEQAYKALNINTEKLDRICLKCNNGGVRYRAV